MKKLIVDISDELKKELKLQAAEQGITLRQLVIRRIDL